MPSADLTIEAAKRAIGERRWEDAERILADINGSAERRTLQSLLMQVQALEAQQRFADAETRLQCMEESLSEPRDKAIALTALADFLSRHGSGNSGRIAACLERSLALDTEYRVSERRNVLCQIYFHSAQYEELYEQASLLAGSQRFGTRARLARAHACFFLGHADEGERQLAELEREAERLNDADLGWLLTQLVRYRLTNRAQALIERLRPLRDDDALLRIFHAEILIRERRYADALEILTPEFIAESERVSPIPGRSWHRRGRALDALGRYKAAHEAFTAMNDRVAALHSGHRQTDPVPALNALDLSSLPEHPATEDAPYCVTFLIGFPRSGTTLLESILDTQHGIHTLSEINGLFAAIQRMKDFGRRYPADLPVLDAREVEALRQAYFDYNARFLPRDAEPRIVVDKLPLNMLHVPLIVTLFPDAPILFMLRHPADVCLSCFQQNFAWNDGMSWFTTLEGTFKRYRAIMQLFDNYRQNLPLNLLTVTYEKLIDDFDAVMEQVFDFLEFEHDTSYRDFFQANREKLVATPSHDQVDRPLYRTSRGRWRNYASLVEPYRELIQPWIEKFGYESVETQ